ncbi:MAG TPA: TetR/AcrR family transcriptional regulator [Paludibaculum sp.]|jgi:AcrR family transcriptional regulator
MAIQSKTKHDVICEFRCSQILAAARTVFAEKGYQEATMDQIAEVAGVAKGTLYSYFPSKRDVYVAELSHGAGQLLELTRGVIASPGDLRSKIQMFIRTRLEYLDSHLEFFKIYHAEFGNLTHPAWVSQQFREAYELQLKLLEDLLAGAVERGEIRAIPAGAVACGIYEMTRGLLLRRVLGVSSAPAAEEAEALGELLWRGIRNE